ncbi:MAG TPA: substrate-binding domain-containing protein [Clostridiales bacterium]|nr:substrate-binding domain-containing protein [Clostridiales bacterium]HQP69184.1 substrate-binding domain-containing protein [Clostridiales bacterium]
MKKMMLLILGLAMIMSVSAQEKTEPVKLTLSTTTSTYETGLLDYMLAPFEKENNCKVHCLSLGTGKAIQVAKDGNADIILVHARADEDKFVAEGWGVNRQDVMYNDFVIMGPKEDPAKIKGVKSATEALKLIADAKQPFVSRGDDSGTHKKEKAFWKKLAITPVSAKDSWYMEAGQGMAATLKIADEKSGYVLVDRATYNFQKDKTRLVLLMDGDDDLLNPYGIIAVNPEKFPHVKYDLAMKMIEFFTSERGQKMIADYKKDGAQLYFPNFKNPRVCK